MILGQPTKRIVVSNGNIEFELFDSGTIEWIKHNGQRINLLAGNSIEGQSANLYLRIKSEQGIDYTPLIGTTSPSEFSFVDNQALYKGVFKGVQYEARLTIVDFQWYWDLQVTNTNDDDVQVDVIYGQDVGLSNAINPAYICQYIDHRAYETENGYALCSRQNVGDPHYLEIGSLTPTVAYSTDGFQFYGLDYRVTNVPEALTQEQLQNKVLQYEFAYIALQSETVTLTPKGQQDFVFYGRYQDRFEDATSEAHFYKDVKTAYEQLTDRSFDLPNGKRVDWTFNPQTLVDAQSLTEEEVNQYYPERRHEERDASGQLLSFFLEDSTHVVLKDKELIVERPHANLLINGNNQELRDDQFATTTYMFGVFNGHIVVGNTDLNLFTSDVLNPLNVTKLSGQRIFIERNGEFSLLGVPSIYEVGPNYSKWIYRLEDDEITITTIVPVDQPQSLLRVESKNDVAYRFIVTNDVVFGGQPVTVEPENNGYVFKPHADTLVAQTYPGISYQVAIDTAYTIQDDRIFYQDNQPRKSNLVVFEVEKTSAFTLTTQGRLDGAAFETVPFDFNQLKAEYLDYIQTDLLKNFNVTIDNADLTEDVNRINDLSVWFTQNAMIHYASPHGLEQAFGAAWGTRDVCQGPAEYFLTTGNFSAVRNILLTLYSHQFIEDGNWPQWFMFDRYTQIFPDESHDDIINWPLHLLGVYLEKTEDYSILDEEVPYLNRTTRGLTDEKESILEHVKRQVATMQTRVIEGTHLPVYGGGDWNDSLQPANTELKDRMVSGWTVSLMYEALNRFATLITTIDEEWSEQLLTFASGIKEDFNRYVVKDGVPAGLLYFNEDNEVEYLLHPEDKKTGINYRLLPMYQGTLAELYSTDQVDNYIDIINNHLRHPDGVRLMNDIIEYKGGQSSVFQRIETAANFGREIGLLYMHAHIRYIEAMAKLGRFEDAWWGLRVVSPIQIQKAVPNALPRQANTYFSSSDGNFADRYEAKRDFNKLRTGDVGVKGGWRVYSSGPGIYLGILIRDILGIDLQSTTLTIDPVLPTQFDGLTFDFQVQGKPVTFQYHVSEGSGVKQVVINGTKVEGTKLDNPYRQGGVRIEQDVLDQLNDSNNQIEIYI